jgi:hypothetical protein
VSKKHKKDREPEMWINPKSNLKGAQGDRAWEDRPGGVPHSSRYLELADICFGVKKPAPKKKTPHSGGTHMHKKTEPYST